MVVEIITHYAIDEGTNNKINASKGEEGGFGDYGLRNNTTTNISAFY